MSLCRLASPPPDLEEEGNRLADEWVEIDTTLTIDEYIYYHASPRLKARIDKMKGISDE